MSDYAIGREILEKHIPGITPPVCSKNLTVVEEWAIEPLIINELMKERGYLQADDGQELKFPSWLLL